MTVATELRLAERAASAKAAQQDALQRPARPLVRLPKTPKPPQEHPLLPSPPTALTPTPQTNPSKVDGQGTHSLPGKIVPPKIGGSHGQSNGHGTQAQPNKEGEQDSHNRPDKNGKTDGGTGHGTHSGKTEEHIVSM